MGIRSVRVCAGTMRAIFLFVILALVVSSGCRPPHPIVPPALTNDRKTICLPPDPIPKSASTASASTTVLRPSAQPSAQDAGRDQILEPINRALADAFFDFDRYDLRRDAVEALRDNAAQLNRLLAAQPALHLMVEGHCDESGSAEYNLGLGERRAEVARDFLIELGIPAGRLRTISYGKEQPLCTEPTETCRQRNRRAHITFVD